MKGKYIKHQTNFYSLRESYTVNISDIKMYTSNPQKLLKSRIAALVQNSFKKRDGSTHFYRIREEGGSGRRPPFI